MAGSEKTYRYCGMTKTASEWCAWANKNFDVGLDPRTITSRMLKGWTIENTLTTPLNRYLTPAEVKMQEYIKNKWPTRKPKKKTEKMIFVHATSSSGYWKKVVV